MLHGVNTTNSSHTPPRTAQGRAGFLLIDLMVALILVGAVASVLPVMLASVYQQRQQERFERLAQLELSNTAVRLQADQEPPVASEAQLSTWFQKTFPHATMKITMGTVASDDLPLVPVSITVSRPGRTGHPAQQQSLTTWVTAKEGE